jgi:hypothetical protein
MFTCGLSDLLLLVVGLIVIFVLLEYILKVDVHNLCQIWNTCIVLVYIVYISCFFKQIVDIYFNNAYY